MHLPLWTWFAIAAIGALGYAVVWCILHIKVTPIRPRWLDRLLFWLFGRAW